MKKIRILLRWSKELKSINKNFKNRKLRNFKNSITLKRTT